jgi:hypothetical protein
METIPFAVMAYLLFYCLLTCDYWSSDDRHHGYLKHTKFRWLSPWQFSIKTYEFTGPNHILVSIFICIILNKNWKNYWSKQSFTVLGAEDLCSVIKTLYALSVSMVIVIWTVYALGVSMKIVIWTLYRYWTQSLEDYHHGYT